MDKKLKDISEILKWARLINLKIDKKLFKFIVDNTDIVINDKSILLLNNELLDFVMKNPDYDVVKFFNTPLNLDNKTYIKYAKLILSKEETYRSTLRYAFSNERILNDISLTNKLLTFTDIDIMYAFISAVSKENSNLYKDYEALDIIFSTNKLNIINKLIDESVIPYVIEDKDLLKILTKCEITSTINKLVNISKDKVIRNDKRLLEILVKNEFPRVRINNLLKIYKRGKVEHFLLEEISTFTDDKLESVLNLVNIEEVINNNKLFTKIILKSSKSINIIIKMINDYEILKSDKLLNYILNIDLSSALDLAYMALENIEVRNNIELLDFIINAKYPKYMLEIINIPYLNNRLDLLEIINRENNIEKQKILVNLFRIEDIRDNKELINGILNLSYHIIKKINRETKNMNTIDTLKYINNTLINDHEMVNEDEIENKLNHAIKKLDAHSFLNIYENK